MSCCCDVLSVELVLDEPELDPDVLLVELEELSEPLADELESDVEPVAAEDDSLELALKLCRTDWTADSISFNNSAKALLLWLELLLPPVEAEALDERVELLCELEDELQLPVTPVCPLRLDKYWKRLLEPLLKD